MLPINNDTPWSEGGSSGSSSCGVRNGGGDGTHLKKGPWTAEEDAVLVEYVRKQGEGNWNAVQRHSGLARCGKSCRLRWANHLKPNLKKGAFSPEEERLIVELHAKVGNKWARMASLLPGRTDNEIKNYWNTRVKRHQRQGLPLYPPDIQPQYPQSPHTYQYHPQSRSTPTSPTSSSFTFQAHTQTQFQSPTPPTTYISSRPPTPTPAAFPPVASSTTILFPSEHHLLNSPSSHSTPTTPTSSFTFQTPYSSTTPPSPTPHSALFDFSAPRTPPILQSPSCFKRFSSHRDLRNLEKSNNIISSVTNLNSNSQSSTHLPLLPPSASSSNASSTALTGLLSISSSEFHRELLKDNQKMCDLYATVTQPELPSNQNLSPTSQNMNTNIFIDADINKFNRKMNKKRNSCSSLIGGDGELELAADAHFSTDDLWLEAKELVESGQSFRKQIRLTSEEEKLKAANFEGLNEHSIPLSLSQDVDAAIMPEDLTCLLDNIPSSMAELYADSGDISNEPSSVVTDDNTGYNLQRVASFIPSTTDHGRTLGPCTWENLPRIC
ncbi:hypothetical protein K2173_003120 [Erythroxylum novogranatense]|uniref:Uncharacterized protein n=1 Tax=Erythroxylum novogranatense TaxID=1862640 RepID=A0AAV8TAD6_9ROSI|nr:hypothetical protein K2173_003120 [Erythroxylum novogranatense]